MSRAVDTARTQLGYREGPHNSTKYGKLFRLDHVSWCAIFVWWVYLAAYNVDLRKTLTKSMASVDAVWRAGKSRGISTTHPQPGDIVINHFPGEHSGGNHTGIFVADAGRSIIAIEGNTGSNDTNGGGVLQRTRSKSLVLGYLHVLDENEHLPVPPPTLPAAVKPSPAAVSQLLAFAFVLGLAKRVSRAMGSSVHGAVKLI